MWLIETSALKLSEFVADEIPQYAILSHRWESSQEVTFKEFRKNLKKDTYGYEKIVACCNLARKAQHQWLWVDTCCIDKRSSAELSEAINSMFLWYQKAKICYVHLRDIGRNKNWRYSGWWKRGWTLQELIAPKHVEFYDREWHRIGTKAKMATDIEACSGIPVSVLIEPGAYMQRCVAERMSWAAGRRTQRIEDKAYCLLGLFRIHMPLLYGEGGRSFQRLQLEILQKYPDESLLAWRPHIKGPHSVLAKNPDDFKNFTQSVNFCAIMSSTKPSKLDPPPRRENPPRVTSWGIELRANARKLERLNKTNRYRREFVWAVTLTIA